MTTVGSYTTAEAIRGCLGIDDEDCPDAVIVDSRLADELVVDLNVWLPTHSTLFATGEADGAAAADAAISLMIKLYAQWFCAYELVTRPFLVPQIVSDGKNQINRFQKIDLEKAAQLAGQRRDKYRAMLDEEINGIDQTASYLTVLAVSTPDYDPVAGE